MTGGICMRRFKKFCVCSIMVGVRDRLPRRPFDVSGELLAMTGGGE